MQIILLGTAAGGGFPQWNCWCPVCRTARVDPARAHARTQSSLAVSDDGTRWVLINASPDVREHIQRIPRSQPADSVVRDVPIEAVALTDAELDHSLGLLLLREARTMAVYVADAAARVLEYDSRILPTMRAFATVSVTPLSLDRTVALLDRRGGELGLTLEAFAVQGEAPRFATGRKGAATIGLVLRDRLGTSAAYVPGCGALTSEVITRVAATDVVLFDGTFWRDDELITLGISPYHAREMGHVPIDGSSGSLAVLAKLGGPVVVYTHINNTNPILIEDSPERRAVEAAGVMVGYDGQVLDVGR